jgi:hypothetical protein
MTPGSLVLGIVIATLALVYVALRVLVRRQSRHLAEPPSEQLTRRSVAALDALAQGRDPAAAPAEPAPADLQAAAREHARRADRPTPPAPP